MPSYREELDAMFVAGAEFLFLRPRCHPEALITAAYSKSQGAVILACATCNFGIADLAVASRTAGLPNLLPKMSEPAPLALPTLNTGTGKGAKPKLEVVPAPTPTPTHVQDQRKAAKNNRRRQK